MTIPRILEAPQKSFFLLGPRGVGKSTYLRDAFPEAHVVDLLSEVTYQRLLANPGLLAAELRAVSADRWVVLDGIQRLPALLNEVQRFIEERKMRFVLCGSSARQLSRAGVNLLAGRALRRAMHPFVPGELGDRFDLEDALQYGLLPIVWDSEDRSETLTAYTQMYLREEIQSEALVRNLPGFARFLPVAALFHAQALNANNIARDAQVSRPTVTSFLEILEETLLCFRLPAYEAKLRARERKLPKWYWCDSGIVRAIKNQKGSPALEERGALFEGLVAQLIRAYKDYRDLCDTWYYWATAARNRTEVDFLLERGGAFVAIEVKSGGMFSRTWCTGLRAVAGLDGLTRRIIVYPEGPEMRTEDGIEVMPFAVFSDLLDNDDLWP